jgi:hypothetical protein
MWPNTLADWAQFLEITESEMTAVVKANYTFWNHLFDVNLSSDVTTGVKFVTSVSPREGLAVTASVLRAAGHGIRLIPVPCGPVFETGGEITLKAERLRGLVAFQGGQAVSAWDPEDDVFARDTSTRLPGAIDLGAEMVVDLTTTQRRTK